MNSPAVTPAPAGSSRYLGLIAGAAALGGLLFGYDTAVISGAIGFIQEHFHLAAGMTGWAASSLLVGCMAGAALAGPLSDRWGRKPLLLACSVTFAASALGSALAPTLSFYTWSRLAGGLGIGAVSVLSPLYLAEVAPEKVRGRLVSLYQLAIVTGILLSFFGNLLIERWGAAHASAGGQPWNAQWGWRWMFAVLVAPAAVFALLLVPLPESPRWLMSRGHRARAGTILTAIGGAASAAAEIVRIEDTLRQDQGRLSELLKGRFRPALIVGVALAIFSQFGGINAIMYYGPELFKAAGSGNDQAFTSTVALGAINLLATFGAIALVDHLGRKRLLVAGTAVQSAALLVIGALYRAHAGPGLILIFILLFLIGFAASTGVVTWVIITEIFPTKLRGQAVGIAVLALWAADYAVCQTFPLLQAGIGPAATFFGYAACCTLGLIFTVVAVPETKGRTLEEIERSWAPRPYRTAGGASMTP